MPYYAALTFRLVLSVYSRHRLVYGKKLLMTADFFNIIVKEDKELYYVKQPLLVKKRNASLVLFRNLPVGGTFFTNFFLPVNAVFVLSPLHEILCRCAGRAVQHLFGLYGKYKLRILEQLRNIFGSHVPDVLQNAFHNVYAGFFALDDDNGNTVAHNNYVRAGILSVRPFNAEFFGYLPNVVIRALKVYVLYIKRLFDGIMLVHNYLFFNADAEREQIVDLFACQRKPLQKRNVKFLDRPFYPFV